MAISLALRSTIVAWLKVVLPLVALALLSTLFLVSRRVDPEQAVSMAPVDVEARAREPRLTAATYAGVTEDGAALTVTADEARPGQRGGDDGSAIGLRARLTGGNGAQTDIVAATGRIDTAAQRLFLAGDVTVTTDAGYVIAAPEMTARLDRTGVETAGGEVVATGRFGRLTAGRMVLHPAAAGNGRYLLDFTGGVRLVYAPPAASPADPPADPDPAAAAAPAPAPQGPATP